jgi:hypothetical protein
MSTKQEERAALAKIRKIVDGLGENSYVASAMTGVWELAEQNIDDDAAYEFPERVRILEAEAKEVKAQLKTAEAKRDQMQQDLERSQQFLRCAHQDRDLAKQDASAEHALYCKEDAKRRAVEEKLAAAELELLRLKAKLYDQMTTGA